MDSIETDTIDQMTALVQWVATPVTTWTPLKLSDFRRFGAIRPRGNACSDGTPFKRCCFAPLGAYIDKLQLLLPQDSIETEIPEGGLPDTSPGTTNAPLDSIETDCG